GLLSGIITLSDLERAARQGLGSRTVGDAATRDLMVCYPDQSLREALAAPAAGEVGRLPVVDPENPRRLLGVLRRSDIIRAYSSGAASSTSARLSVRPEQP
ncbi:MAG: CBS domain-containing protein, partial [Armatimonadetes bacterium]|nr:CBS domain-containing protein [Armatimonadota bacterium]